MMPRPNYTLIATLEHTLLGISPPTGSFGALAGQLRQAGTCFAHQPVADVDHFPVRLARCSQCDQRMHLGKSGAWELLVSGSVRSEGAVLEPGERVLPLR